jgi:hypothetical protein
MAPHNLGTEIEINFPINGVWKGDVEINHFLIWQLHIGNQQKASLRQVDHLADLFIRFGSVDFEVNNLESL